MSWIENLVLGAGIIRDWKFSNPLAIGQVIEADKEEAVALDLFIRNRGAAAITVALDGQPVITVDAGDPFMIYDTVMRNITIVAAVQYDLLVTGVKLQTLTAMGLVR